MALTDTANIFFEHEITTKYIQKNNAEKNHLQLTKCSSYNLVKLFRQLFGHENCEKAMKAVPNTFVTQMNAYMQTDATFSPFIYC